VIRLAIGDTGLPSIDPHTTLANLIEANMVSPDGVWTPVVNPEWLEYKKQKTYQIAIQPMIGLTSEAFFDSTSTTIAKTSQWFGRVCLFAPTRVKCWEMMAKFLVVMNNGVLTFPSAGLEPAGNGAYQYARITRSDESKPVRYFEPECGPSGDAGNCIGYRTDYTVELRWGE